MQSTITIGAELMRAGARSQRLHLLIGHTHWDHIQGFPFFPPIFVPGNRFAIYGNARSSSMLEGVLEGHMNPHFSPRSTPSGTSAPRSTPTASRRGSR